ncbi:hypothetical protein KR222_005583 [Zaprionus bogoriensis]|nr:hypothetical protein KR222_005583 [Zaprionus bogoriensis]
MIQEPARVQAPIYEQESNTTSSLSGKSIYSSNCACSKERTSRIASRSGTTIPIVINSHPNPRIILIKVPAYSSKSNSSISNNNHNSNNNNNNTTSSRAELTEPRTRLIRIPFLPGPVPTTSSVKRALPTANVSVNYTTPATASRIATQALTPTGIIYPHERCSNNSYSQSNQVASDQTLGPPTTATKMVTQTVEVSSQQNQSSTLAAMAGIQLTGADTESRQGMSGAMPTATVEEIDVPVFIDEYLQNIEASSSTSCSGKSEENGKETCTETDIIDFDFDINLFAEDFIERKEMDLWNLQQDMTYSNNSDTIDNIDDLAGLADEQQFPQLGEEEEAFDMGSMLQNGIDFNQDQPDFDNILTRPEENPMLGNFSQSSIFSSSQTKYIHEQPLLADENSTDNNNYNICSQGSLGFGQVEAANVEVGLFMQEAPSSTLCVGAKRTASMAGLVSKVESMPQKRNQLILNINKSLITQSEAINTPDIIEHVLDLDEVSSRRVLYPCLLTSTNYSNLLRPQHHAVNPTTQNRIYEELRSTEENTAFTTIQDFSPPNTPYSAYSVSTSHSHSYAPASQITAPVSPAFSSASTSQFSVTTSTSGGSGGPKRKRGRPAKEHADGPDPEAMSQMTPEELKQYCDRIKNNEASRVSRRKTKKREDEEVKEEESLQAENVRLNAILDKVLNRKKLLEDYLKQNHYRRSTYVKPEPEH